MCFRCELTKRTGLCPYLFSPQRDEKLYLREKLISWKNNYFSFDDVLTVSHWSWFKSCGRWYWNASWLPISVFGFALAKIVSRNHRFSEKIVMFGNMWPYLNPDDINFDLTKNYLFTFCRSCLVLSMGFYCLSLLCVAPEIVEGTHHPLPRRFVAGPTPVSARVKSRSSLFQGSLSGKSL